MLHEPAGPVGPDPAFAYKKRLGAWMFFAYSIVYTSFVVMQTLSIILFVAIVGIVLALSFYFARRAKSASGYYAAGGTIHWSVNGVAFAGDYLSAAINTLVVSICYLIPQMVGAGALVTPLLGLPHFVEVIIVGLIVITIVATAGMTSTTYVLFIKGGLLVVFSIVLVIVTLFRGLSTTPGQGDELSTTSTGISRPG